MQGNHRTRTITFDYDEVLGWDDSLKEYELECKKRDYGYLTKYDLWFIKNKFDRP